MLFDGSEKGPVAGRADMFEHPDGNDTVEFTLKVAVVAEIEPRLFCKPSLLGALARQRQLLLRKADA